MKLDISFQEAPLPDGAGNLVIQNRPIYDGTSPQWLLILEDDENYAHLLEEQVVRTWPQCCITVVSDRKEFIDALKAQPYDIILSDYYLPHFSGISALALVREHYPKIPFIFVSGAIGDDVGIECLKLGANDYVLKGRLTRLVPAIERALDEARRNRERELVATQLEQSNSRYENLVNSVDGIVWQADQEDMQFTFVSNQTRWLLGYSSEQWLQNKDFWHEHVHPEDYEAAVGKYRKLTLQQGHRQIEYRMLAADGRTVWLRDNVSLSLQSNRRLKLQGIMVDVTESKESEAELNSIQITLQEYYKDLLLKNKEIQNFYHTLSHELKTPLTSAREFISLVMEGVAGPLTETQQEYLGIAKKSCDQLRVCVNDLIDATRVETGKMSLELKRASLTNLVSLVATASKSPAAERGITVSLEAPREPLEIVMDENRILQVVTNLVNNAINHTPRGGRIVVKAHERSSSPGFVEVSVVDTGCGIPKDEQERIFNRLYQIKTGDATTKQGIGLGLYLCKELVQLHGGDISVDSEIDHGSRFKFILPKDQLSFRPNVLVIDDDPDILEMTCNALKEDYNVRRASSGEEGLDELRKRQPDVLLLDLSMPDVNGVDVLKQIRTQWSNIQVIVHTAYSSGEMMRQAMDFSPFTLLSKPSSITQLRDTVKNVLRSMATTIWKRKHMVAKAALAT